MTAAADLESVQLHYVETSAEAAEFIEWLGRPRKTVAVDTETTGLARDARIRLIQFGDELDAWTLRWDRWKGTAVEGLELLKRARQRISLHNSPYDVPKVEAQSAEAGRWPGFRFDWGLIDDTMLMSRLASPLGSHSLKNLAARLVDPRSRAMQSVLTDAMSANGWTWETVPYDYEGYTVYAGIDCVLTARVLPEVEKTPFSRDLYETEMTVAEACVRMAEVGMAVDLGYCDDQIRLLGGEIADLVEQGKREHRLTALGSDQIVIAKLQDYGLYWDERTDKGRVKLDKDVLGRLGLAPGPGGRLATLVLEYRQRVRLMQAYFRHFVEGDDGRVHPDINSLEAVTGRMAISEPAMQQLPRGPRVRRAIVADPGSALMLMDYSQIEVRVLAHYSGDALLREAIATGDVHTASAQLIFGRDEVTPQERQLAKSSSLAIIYGAGDEKFSHTAGVSLEVGAAFLQEYHRRFPQVRPFMERVQGVGRTRLRSEGQAYVTTRDGRKLGMRKTDAFYTLVNYLCQGTAADIFKRAIQRLWNAGYGDYMRLPVHDEMIWQLPDGEDHEEFARSALKEMEDHSFEVPMVVEASGPYRSWADKYGAGPPA